MRVRPGIAVVVTSVAVLIVVAPVATGATTSVARDSVTQKYHCTTPVGDINEEVTVAGTAGAGHGSLQLRKVTYGFLNNFGVAVTIKKIRFSVPDPDPDNAPYRDGSATVAGSPKGWTAGHQSSGIFEFFKGTEVLGDGETLAVPALSATYRSAGPDGTLIEWKPGSFSFVVTTPDAGTIACTPKKPVQTFASINE